MKLRLAVTALFLTVFFSAPFCWSAGPITFDGPKYTYLDDEHSPAWPMIFPGNFSTYNFFAASDKLDLAVPTFLPGPGTVQGLNNQNTWGNPDNGYFLHQYLTNEKFPRPHQVIAGGFNGNSAVDLAILTYDNISTCYDYNGADCMGGISGPKAFSVNDVTGKPYDLHPWAGAVGKINSDGRDEVAVAAIGFNPTTLQYEGYLIVWTPPSSSGGADEALVYGPTPIVGGMPLSLAVGDYNGDNKLDVATASATVVGDGGAFLDVFTNNNVGSLNAPQQVESFKVSECRNPTGLIAYDPDADNKSDLVLTCYDRFVSSCTPMVPETGEGVGEGPLGVCAAAILSGPVVILKNGSPKFSRQQTIDVVENAYSTAQGDFDGDNLKDLAVAENGGKLVRILAGVSTFKVEDPGVAISTSDAGHDFSPKFIQVADMNGDTLPDVVGVSAFAFLPTDFSRTTNVFKDTAPVALLDTNLESARLLVGTYEGWGDCLRRYTPTTELRHFSTGTEYAYTSNYVLSDSPGGNYAVAIALDNAVLSTIDRSGSAVTDLPPDSRCIPKDGVFVLVNTRPNITIKEPDCNTKVVSVTIKAHETYKITTVTFASPEIPEAVANFQTTGLNTSTVEGTFNLPQENKKYTFTVTATDNNSKTYTLNSSIDRTDCLGAAACPGPEITPQATAYWDDPWVVCVPKAISAQAAGKAISWGQKNATGSTSVFETGTLMAESATPTGECLKGRFNPYGMKTDSEVTVELTYTLTDPVTKAAVGPCPAKAIYKPPTLSAGSTGFAKCSLGGAETAASPGLSTWMSGLLLPMASFFVARRRAKKNLSS